MKKIKSILFLLTLGVLFSSCVYTKHPFACKLTRGNLAQDTTVLGYNELPKKVQDTLSIYYEHYYSNDSLFYPELISLTQNVDICFIEYVTFPNETLLFHTPGYYFRIGNKKYFFDYRKYKTPIIYYENTLYYFSGKYSVKKDRYTFKSQSDYKNKLFIKYHLKKSNLKKHSVPQVDCNKKSDHNFINSISP